MSIFAKPAGLTFKAAIKPGAAIGQDHGYYRWPNAAHPMKRPEDFGPDMVFDVTMMNDGQYFDCRRPGYGELRGNYGNGSIFVNKIDDLDVSDADRKRVIDSLTAKKKAEIEAAAQNIGKLYAELAEIQHT